MFRLPQIPPRQICCSYNISYHFSFYFTLSPYRLFISHSLSLSPFHLPQVFHIPIKSPIPNLLFKFSYFRFFLNPTFSHIAKIKCIQYKEYMLKSLKPQLLFKKKKKKFLLPILSYHYVIMPLEFSVISLITIHILPLMNGRKTVFNIVTVLEDIKSIYV